MYDEYVTMMVEHPLVGRIDGGNYYYCAAADSPHYIPALTIIRRLNSEFLKAKYGTLMRPYILAILLAIAAASAA